MCSDQNPAPKNIGAESCESKGFQHKGRNGHNPCGVQQEPQGPDGHAAEEGAALRHGARSVLRSCRRFYIFIQSPPRAQGN